MFIIKKKKKTKKISIKVQTTCLIYFRKFEFLSTFLHFGCYCYLGTKKWFAHMIKKSIYYCITSFIPEYKIFVGSEKYRKTYNLYEINFIRI